MYYWHLLRFFYDLGIVEDVVEALVEALVKNNLMPFLILLVYI